MKKLILLMFLASTGWAACPLYTYPENHKLDQEVNNICDNILNPTIAQATVSSGTFLALDMKSNKITSLANGTASTDAATFGQIHLLQFPVCTNSTSGASTTSNSTSHTNISVLSFRPVSASSTLFLTATFDVSVSGATESVWTFADSGTNIASSANILVWDFAAADNGNSRPVTMTATYQAGDTNLHNFYLNHRTSGGITLTTGSGNNAYMCIFEFL